MLGPMLLTAATPYTPDHYLFQAKHVIDVSQKTSFLKQLMDEFPATASARTAREHLIALFSGSNRFDDALLAYEQQRPAQLSQSIVDFPLLNYWLKTGHYTDILRETGPADAAHLNLGRDLTLLEIRVQAQLALGQYVEASEETEAWLTLYKNEGTPDRLYNSDIKSIRYLARHLKTLVRTQGAAGKPLYTAAVSSSMNRWSRRQDVPIHFYKLIPARSGGARPEMLQSGRYESDAFFNSLVNEMNHGFEYLSGGRFSLAYQTNETLYVQDGDLDPESAGGRILTSRVYAHTIPELYRRSGDAFIVLVDYRERAEDDAAYMGDGIIRISARKLQTVVLMHEILHGLGATHKDWNYLERAGYHFDPNDRGLMTFGPDGDLPYFGLEANGIQTIYTNDRDFWKFPGLKPVDPFRK